MKRARIFAALFLLIFGLAVATTVLTADRAEAMPTIIYCSRDTGPNCTNPTHPYYLYVIDYGVRTFVGCCSGLWD